MPKKILTAMISLLLASCAHVRQPESRDMSVSSPNGSLTFKLLPDGHDGQLHYEILSHFATAIEPSQLVFTINNDNIASGAAITAIADYSANTTYPTHGVHSLAANHFNGSRFMLRHREFDYCLDVRAFNDAIAFRFIVPGKIGERRTLDESTVFTLPPTSTIWSHDLSGPYHGTYAKKWIEQVHDGDWVALPLTAKLPGKDGYASITEAALPNYPGMSLHANDHHGYVIGLGHRRPLSQPTSQSTLQPVAVEGTITTPWRVVIVGKDLNTLVNSDALPNLGAPADYPPMIFDERRADTTRAHQIAMPIIITPSLPTFAANSKTIGENPAADFIRSIPATWDQTIVLPPSAIGEIAVFARRSGTTWFLAVVNGPEPKHVEIPLTFLSTGNHGAMLVREEPLNGSAVRMQHAILRPIDMLTLDLPAGGGFAGRFSP